jgi:hypothetical protein
LAFSKQDYDVLIAVKGVGPTVIRRFEEMGYGSISALAKADMMEIVSHGAAMTGSSCWKNSPLARAAVTKAIEAAQRAVDEAMGA